MIARKVHSLTTKKSRHDKTFILRQNKNKCHDSTNSSFIDQTTQNKIMIARKGNCLTTTKQQKQKHDGTNSSFIYKKNKNKS